MNELSTTRIEAVPLESYSFRYRFEDVARIEREAQEMRARIIAEVTTSGGRAVWRAVKWTAGEVAEFFALVGRATAARETYETLSRLSDRQLEDIGLKRDEIADRVADVLRGADATQSASAELYAVKGGKSAKPKVEAPNRRAA